MSEIHYQAEPQLSVSDFVSVLQRCSLGERRPVDDLPRMQLMIDNASLIYTARRAGEIVGMARAVTDYCYCTYLADLAVIEEAQGQGIGRELINRIHAAAGEQTMLILLAAPDAETYYPHVGLTQHHSCWTIPRKS